MLRAINRKTLVKITMLEKALANLKLTKILQLEFVGTASGIVE